ncbi:MAG: prepilin-type N-terminal cleavage/methylation domain-containing protein [Candidatus Shapirobacteria bacterium]
MRKKINFGGSDGGFTLVELLIVIALIAVLAVALIATLNPIEQVNKARDARFQNDSAEVLAAVERYYATQLYYPWADEVWLEGNGLGESVDVGLTSRMPGMGVCSGASVDEEVAGSCITAGSDEGALISTDELKDSFASKDQFSSAVTYIDKLYLWREGGTSGIYVCYIPKANSNRQLTSNPNDLAIDDNGFPTQKLEVTELDEEEFDYSDAQSSYFKCVPE